MNQANNSDTPPGIPLLKKRGRPRKERGDHPGTSPHRPPQNGQTHHLPPGFGRANGDQERVDRNNDEATVGQAVSGVIEAALDSGYLLSVRVGNSESCLRGVVFKQGHYVPVSSENDIAPQLQMIRRNEVSNKPIRRRGRKKRDPHLGHPPDGSFPGNQLALVTTKQPPIMAAQAPSPLGSRGTDGSFPGNQLAIVTTKQPPVMAAQAPSPLGSRSTDGSFSGNQLAIVTTRQAPVMAAQPPPMESRGTVVPVLLQPVSLSNGAAPAIEPHPIASQPAHLAASKPKQVHLAQANREIPVSSQIESGSASVSMREGRAPGVAFEELVSEAAKRIRGSPAENESGKTTGLLSPKQEPVQDLSHPLLIKPLQAIQSDFPDKTSPAGKMTELLLAVQQNEKQMANSLNKPGN